MLRRQELGQRMQSSQPRVARGYAVAAFLLQLREEAGDQVRAQHVDIQGFDRPPGVLRREAQEQNNGVAVASDRVTAHASLRW